MTVIAYKCPSCGGNRVFDSETGKLTCHSCGRSDEVEESTDALTSTVFQEDEAVEYHCTSCGAVIVMEEETTATNCSFCGSSVVLGDRLTGKLAPDLVIPFSISKDEAMKAFRKWCKNGRLTPNGFMTADRVKSMTGIYVPFWLYDLHNQIEVSARGTKVRVYTRGDYQYTETQHYDIYRELQLQYTKLPIDASEKMNDELMDKLEPYPYEQLKDFKTPYLAGFIAEKYNYTDQELLPRAKEKISDYVDTYIRSTMPGYASVQYTSKQVDTEARRADYALLPVWLLNYDFNKMGYTFAMNGQTGKVVGKPPISKRKVTAWLSGIFLGSFVSLKLLSWMIGGVLW